MDIAARREYQRKYQAKWRAKYPERVRAIEKRYRAKHEGAVQLASNHKLSIEEARVAISAKPGACEICDRDKCRLYYDHDHTTGKHRGWLCNRCNVALNLVDQPDLLAAALKYLGGN